ncbi:serine hydrolase [Paenibacillus apiarius]|uniref:Serine hydrolase n=1 Tax=Paenibacillus apiarius TaxID=46240 RepID=A0ABT4DSZ0_9BACL|nr:serine hydrolase [Paenibacillus apiarius]MCY9513818.1 serine hydrolase [Paenibacillus apiarius]MCY9520482.1 serine hydrolase [Paenibacillus apiarius]MCY9550615.1 serine hydrolase [Paenibacillus apiarius]MCY9559136.1 serine hydrolase [Paenibacillus apiarius]MCY9683069.1 serine hydrolase [Paenibacillus apiarius]
MKTTKRYTRQSGKKGLLCTLALAMALSLCGPVYAAEGTGADKPASSSTAAPTGQTSAASAGPTDSKEVEAFADKLFASPKLEKVPGAVFVVVKDGKVLLSKGYGYADVAAKKPMDPDNTVMRVASVTKPFTSAALLQLAEQGKIDLKKDVEAYMGGMKIPRKVKGPLTAEHLMTYTSGFDFADTPSNTNIDNISDFVRHFMPTVVRKPGETYMYDNFGFMLQGYIVEQVAGMPFNQYAKKHLLDPLAMNHSSFVMTPETKAGLSVSYQPTGAVLPYYETMPADSPDGSLLSSGGDMAKFMIALLSEGTYDGKQILKPETVRSMLDVKVSSHPQLPNTSYGFEASYREAFNGQNVIGKGGDLPGFSSWMWLLPEHKTGAFVIFNRNDGMADNFREYIFKSFMDRYYPDNRPEPVFLKPTQKELKLYEGNYRDLRTGFYVVRVEAQANGTLELADPFFGRQRLRQVDPLLFVNDQGQQIGFKRNADGSIAYMDKGGVAWSEKLTATEVKFKDIGADHPYRPYVRDLVMRGGIDAEAGARFWPRMVITRAEFVSMLMASMHLKRSANPPAFSDTIGHAAAQDIQTAVEWGVLTAAADKRFEPDRPITRQEAAALIWRIASLLGVPKQDAKISGDTGSWALPAVKYIVAGKKHGPEVTPKPDGSVDYNSTHAMLREEAAALISTFLASPMQ